MNKTTIERLNQINRKFYQITAASFDETRGNPWPGWETLVPHLQTPLSVLDVGCGNGRFGIFLAEKFGATIIYTGLDNNATLLKCAQSALDRTGIEYHLEDRDIVYHPPEEGKFDLVALFGVLHHIPGSDQRRTLIQQLADRVAQGGLLAFAAWRFYDFERFRSRIIPWPDDLEVEPHDYLLDWLRDVHAIRYCHFVDDFEHADLIAASGLTEIITYRADGRTNDLNCYSLLRRANV